jgi:fibronectin-binding autotransporter adhesin
MPTWKKIIVSGSQAHLAAVTASNGVLVGTNQQITTSPSTTFLSGSFSGSFFGNGSGLTGVTAAFPTTLLTPIIDTTQVFVNDGTNKYATVSQFKSSSWAGVSGDILINPTTGVATIQPDSVALGTDTTGNYVTSVAHSTGITAIPAASEGAAVTVSVSGASTLNTNAVTKWTGAAFANSSLTDNGTNITGATSLQLTGANSSLTGSFSGSFNGTITGTASWAVNAISSSVTSVTDTTTGTGPYYITFTDASTGHPLSRVDSTGLTYNATTNVINGTASLALTASNITPAITNNADNRVLTANGNGTINGESNLTFDGSLLTVTGDVAVNGPTSADITTTTTTATVFNTNATTVNIAGAGTTVTIGAGTGNTTVNNNLTVTGDLTVNGTTTTINTSNLSIEDRFVLLASGSTTNTDGGIVVQNAAGGTGSAIYWEGNDQRWAVNPAVAQNATSVAANSYIPTISGSSGNPSGNPLYGATDATRIGAMYVNTADESIWIWS